MFKIEITNFIILLQSPLSENDINVEMNGDVITVTSVKRRPDSFLPSVFSKFTYGYLSRHIDLLICGRCHPSNSNPVSFMSSYQFLKLLTTFFLNKKEQLIV